MKADDKTVQNLLSPNGQYIIPLFQRNYSWKRDHWLRLLSDVERLLSSNTPQHFLGSIVCLGDPSFPGTLPTFQLIDGQQRLTTLTLLLAALRDVAKRRGEPAMAEEITESFLIHKHRKSNERYKILPRVGDRVALTSIIDGKPDHEAFAGSQVDEAWRFFMRHIEYKLDTGGPGMLGDLFKVITGRLSLVIITVDGEDPYEIFESLNTAGLPLSQADLIRNFVFMQVDMDEQDEFDKSKWAPMEDVIRAIEHKKNVDLLSVFYRDYHIRRWGFIEKSALFLEFKRAYLEASFKPDQLAEDLKRFAKLYVWLREPAKCPKKLIREQLKDITLSDIGTANPIILHLLSLWDDKKLKDDQLCHCLRDLVSFALRRSVCGEGTGSYGKWFAEAIPQLQGNVVDALRGYLEARGWPNDEFFVSRMETFPIYRRESLKTRLVLLGLEYAFQHKEPISPADVTIEHIMPQTLSRNAGSKEWKAMLGDNWEETHDQYLDVIGNLTLTGYNSPLGNKSFAEKKTLYAKSNVQLNKEFARLKQWTAQDITERGKGLAVRIADLWPKPVTGIYKPPVQMDTTNARDERRERYWRGMLEAVKGKDGELPALRVERNGTYFQGHAIELFDLWAWTHFGPGSLKVGCSSGIGCSAAVDLLIKRLAEDRTAIERELGFELEWEAPRGGPQVFIRDTECVPSDESDWEIEHAWASSRLIAMNNVLMRRFEDILTDDALFQETLGSLKPSRVWHLRYWLGLKRSLLKSSLPHRFAGVWQDQYFRKIVQERGIRLAASVRKDTTGVHIVSNVPAVNSFWSDRKCTKAWQGVAEEIGAEILPREDDSRSFSLRKNEDTRDEMRWNAQHECIVRAATAIYENIFPLLQSYVTVADDSEDEDQE